jgi:hypothetical protein
MRFTHNKNYKRKRFGWGRRVFVLFMAVVLVVGIFTTILKPTKAAADISFLSQANNIGTNVTSVTVNKPAGVAAGTVMVALVTFYNTRTTVTTTAPAGWTHLGSQISTNNRYQNVYYKVATAAEPATYAWTFSRASYIGIGISAFSGVSATTPVDASATQTDASSTTPAAPSAVANSNGDMLLALWGYGRQITASSYSAGLTQSFTTSTTNVGIAGAYRLLSNAGSTGTSNSTITTASTATAHTVLLKAAQAPAGIQFVAADTPATCTGCTTLSPAAPAGWKAGHLFITSVSWNTAGVTVSPPSANWTQIDTTASDGNFSRADYYYFAQTGDPATYTWTFSGTTRAVISTVAFSGVDSDQPIDVSAMQTDGAATSHNSPSVTTNFSNDMLFDIWTYEGGLLASTHTSTTTQAWSARSNTNTNTDVGTWAGYESLGNAGATGTRNTTVTSTRAAMMHTITLKPFLPTPQLYAPGDGDIGVQFNGTQFQLSNVSLSATPLKYRIQLCSSSTCSAASIISTFDQTVSQTGWSGQDASGGTAYTGGTTIDQSTVATYTVQTPLNSGTQYWWRAYSFDTGSSTLSLPSVIQTFRTQYIPSAPTLFTPGANTGGVQTQPEFQIASIDGDGDSLKYKIQLCADATCTTVLATYDQTADQTGWSGQDNDSFTTYGADQTTVTDSTVAYYDTPGVVLSPNTTYYWRAYAIDPGGSNTWSAASTIQTFSTNITEVRILNGNILSGVIR